MYKFSGVSNIQQLVDKKITKKATVLGMQALIDTINNVQQNPEFQEKFEGTNLWETMMKTKGLLEEYVDSEGLPGIEIEEKISSEDTHEHNRT